MQINFTDVKIINIYRMLLCNSSSEIKLVSQKLIRFSQELCFLCDKVKELVVNDIVYFISRNR